MKIYAWFTKSSNSIGTSGLKVISHADVRRSFLMSKQHHVIKIDQYYASVSIM